MAKCSECGFLTIRDKKNCLLVEVNDDYRVSGNVPSYLDEYERFYNYPTYFTMAYDLFPLLVKPLVFLIYIYYKCCAH